MAVSKEDIRNLLRIFEQSDWNEMRVEVEGLKLSVSKSGAMAHSAESPRVAPSSASAAITSASPVAANASTPSATLAQSSAQSAVAGALASPALAAGQVYVKAPNMGVFWRQPKPGAPPYVAEGEVIDPDTTVCLIEVMKLFTPVKSGVGGKVVRCLIEDGEMVEHDTPLFIVQQ